MNTTFVHFIIQHYGYIIMTSLFFLYFLVTNRSFSPNILKYFYYSLVCIVALTISDIGQVYFAKLTYPTWQRMFFASLSYTLRIFVIFSIFMLFCRDKPKRYKILVSIPAVINFYASFSAFFTEKAFYYTADNVIVRGPIISIPFIVSAVYFILLIYNSTQKSKRGDNQEVVLVNIIFFFAAATTVMEAKFEYYGVLPGLAVIGIMVYYMYFMSDKYYYDPLTEAAVRARLYENVRNVSRPFGVIMFDLNDLKKMNDTEGHLAGDRALKGITRAVMDAIPESAKIYRIGGDEFIVTCEASSEKEVEVVVQTVREAIASTPYTAAVGYTLRIANEPLERALGRADESMYNDKTETKKKRTGALKQ